MAASDRLVTRASDRMPRCSLRTSAANSERLVRPSRCRSPCCLPSTLSSVFVTNAKPDAHGATDHGTNREAQGHSGQATP